MAGLLNKTVTAGAFTLVAAAPAAADYTILEDTSMPSVVFIEFDGDEISPTVISAPGNGASAVVDPALPPVSRNNRNASSGSEEGTNMVKPQASAGGNNGSENKSVEDRVNEKIAELEKTEKQIEKDVVNEVVDDKVLDELNLR